jgi:hypothetical protein
MGEICSTQEKDGKCITIVIGETEERRQLARPRRGWKDNIILYLKE